MADERLVVLNRSDNLGFGFSLLGEAGLPHIIYEIEENSPAARSGEVEAGDVLLKVNGTDVNRFTTREVLKCLRLSSDPVTLRLKKDPQVKANVRRYLASTERRNSAPRANNNNGSGVQSGESCEALLADERVERRPRAHQPKFEAYMMTGDLMLNLSRVEHPHHNNHAPMHRTHYHRYNSTPASPNEGRLGARGETAQRHNSSPDTGLKESSLSAVAVEMEEDVTSSLNTLLDARPDSATPGPRSESDAERDRRHEPIRSGLEHFQS
ncbi:hypothetical protein MSG28_002714 [Choristoneura fumiferana]|uniref:Uncharacterized protein n=1 Tax=Choristoneura fumiferana TaxID=7141 RepID=A0ACC0JJ15_CHOFU|nr:hypothetical protein MSG28_002714 [Choristoneura fumiferana]